MDMAEKFKTALSGIGIPVEEAKYPGKLTEYIEFSISDQRPGTFADDTDITEITFIDINYYRDAGSASKIKSIRKALRADGFKIGPLSGPFYEDETELYHTNLEVHYKGASETQEEDY